MSKLLLLIAASLVSFPLPVMAQSADTPQSELGQTVYARDRKLAILLTRETQNPDTRAVTYRLLIVPSITSDRVEVEWYVTGVSGVSAKDSKQRRDIDLVAGKQVTESFTVIPQFFGQSGQRLYARTEVSVEVRSFHAGQNYIVAARDQFDVNQELEIFPYSAEYEQAKRTALIRNILIIGAIILVSGIVLGIGYFKLKQWLKQGE